MTDEEWLAARFEENRPKLRAIAFRMLGSLPEAEDAVQEAWLRLSRTETSGVENFGGWLTTVVSRICLDMLRTRKSRREEFDAALTERVAGDEDGSDPEREAVVADSVGLAVLVVLEMLSPAERVAFVLHEMFAMPFEQIAPIVGRTPAAARQLASRARRRVRGVSNVSPLEVARRRKIVDAFLTASRDGDFAALIALLDPNIVLRADSTAVKFGAETDVRGAESVAKQFAGRARAAQPAMVDGTPGLVWAQNGKARVAFAFTFANGKIAAIELFAERERLERVEF